MITPRGSVCQSLQGSAEADPPQVVPRQPMELWLHGNMALGVSKAFIDEITSLAAAGRAIPRRLRKLEGSYERNETIKMRRFHYESALAAAASLPPSAEPLQAPVDLHPAAFGTGQSVHHWWSSWFKNAEEPRSQLQGNNRPKWYDASIVCALGVKRVKYAGHWFEEHTYQVH